MSGITISPGPHIKGRIDTAYMMRSVIIALVPAVAAGLYFFRIKAAVVMIVAVSVCVITEALLQKARKRKLRISDGSAVLTGLLLALILPPTTPLWMVFIGGVFAIALGKEVFGGLGNNIFNPALLARAFLMAAFPVALTSWSYPFTLDAVTTATPLGMAKFAQEAPPAASLFLGNIPGCIGETSALALLAGIGYLLYKKVIDHRIPAAYIGTVAAISSITHLISPGTFMGPVFHLLAGGLLLGAGFMATDPVSTPVTVKGRWMFGMGAGIITMIIRLWGGMSEGVMYSILLMNACAPLMDRIGAPRRFGTGKNKKAKQT